MMAMIEANTAIMPVRRNSADTAGPTTSMRRWVYCGPSVSTTFFIATIREPLRVAEPRALLPGQVLRGIPEALADPNYRRFLLFRILLSSSALVDPFLIIFAASTLGVTFGWSGVYFTLLAGALSGRTLGKIVLRIRALKTDGKPFTFFDAFVRHGGYIAGVAMGLTGFLRLLWEPNRQAVEDRIAGTVVVKA